MSTEFTKAVSICIHSTGDLFLGYTLATVIDTFFMAHTGTSPSDIQLLGSVIAQACISMLAAESIRRLAWMNPEDDPSGGIMFITSLNQQPQLWKNMSTLYTNVFSKWMADSNNNANPDSNT